MSQVQLPVEREEEGDRGGEEEVRSILGGA